MPSSPKPKPTAKRRAKPKPKAKPKPNAAAKTETDAAAAKQAQRDAYPQRWRPSQRVIAQWNRRGRATGEKGYTRRWSEFWRRVVTHLAKRDGWDDIDLYLVEQYVKRCRLVELHGEEAELKPYASNLDTGVIRAHPGWERALAEAREARSIAKDLRLTPEERRGAGIDVPRIDRPKNSGAEDEPAGGGWTDNQRGQDGESL